MACEVEWIPLGDIVNLSSGGTPDKKQPAYWDGEIPWISAKTLTGDTVTTSNLFITEEGLHAGSKLAPVGSILLLTRGSGLFKRIPLAIVNAPVAYNQDVKCMTSKVTTITNEYVFFALKALSPELTNMLETTGIGAGKLATERLLDMPIPVLSHDEREKAVSFFSALSRKIMINNRINDYLEQCLLARYDHLFRGAGTYNGTISDIGDVVGGATPSKKRPEYYCHEGIGWITPKDLSNTTNKFVAHGADDITRVGFDSCSIKKLPAGTVLFSSRAPIGYIAIASDEVTTNQGFKSIVPHKEIGTAFVYCFLVRNKDRIADAGSGTTFPEVSGKTMAGIELTLPNINLCAKFEEWASPLLEEQRHLEDENRQLEDLRDTLLPKLMSGEIDVSKVDLTQLTNNHLADC